ncbi:helix-turn-helix domain-containing protein [Pseudonocardia humida]|uniref:Helix-turn-helix transcriptional regulator n=1 Tax=Pseudonocardia humida TaxID=2800819 RepID=A0ABT0ZX06_9PSEU|nr:helix-turn-helix transcriptional regulator [Pseudonocardia humida]MCO1655258.1 helix-turn-helix transcriptional regulator [Pseudonocardia humida]
MTSAPTRTVGDLLRDWRLRRHLSQLDLATIADVSTRHLSWLETGRSRPTAQMILRLAESMDVPLRERNTLLLAGGFAPAFSESSLDSLPLGPVLEALRAVLAAHEPFPAVVVDRAWELVEANAGIQPLLAGVTAELVEPPVNVLRLSLHPDGLAPRIVNLPEWRSHLLARLARQAATTGDPGLADLLAELRGYPGGEQSGVGGGGVVVPMRLRHDGTVLSFLSTTTVFGTPRDVTVDELALEAFYPADAATRAALLRAP